jgi:hypothetical protein
MHATQGLQPPPFTGANSLLWDERPLYEFSQSDLLARQARQESNARSYPRRGGFSSIAWRGPAR